MCHQHHWKGLRCLQPAGLHALLHKQVREHWHASICCRTESCHNLAQAGSSTKYAISEQLSHHLSQSLQVLTLQLVQQVCTVRTMHGAVQIPPEPCQPAYTMSVNNSLDIS